jgi:hypothetical protein
MSDATQFFNVPVPVKFELVGANFSDAATRQGITLVHLSA